MFDFHPSQKGRTLKMVMRTTSICIFPVKNNYQYSTLGIFSASEAFVWSFVIASSNTLEKSQTLIGCFASTTKYDGLTAVWGKWTRKEKEEAMDFFPRWLNQVVLLVKSILM